MALDRSVIALERKLHPIDGIAGLDLSEQTGRKVEVRCRLVEILVDLREHRDVLG